MATYIPKSEFKPKAFKYFRLVEETHEEITITDHGKPVVKIVPYKKTDETEIRELRNLVVLYDDPFEPAETEWEALK